MNLARLEERYGPLGPVFRALVALEATESLERLGIIVHPSFLSGNADPLPQYGHPRDLLVFLDTGSDDTHAAFLMTGERATLDARPIVIVRRDAPACRVVAPNLAAFLGLAAIAGVDEIERDRTDASWRAIRHEREENDPDGEFERLAAFLCTIPGVAVPPLPAVVTHAHPDVTIEDDGELAHRIDMSGPGTPLERIERVWKAGNVEAARKELDRQIDTWLDIAHLVHESSWRALESLLERLDAPLSDDRRAKLRAAGVRV